MKIRPMGAEFYAEDGRGTDGQTDRQTDWQKTDRETGMNDERAKMRTVLPSKFATAVTLLTCTSIS
jgi:hypothetical protein